MNRLDRALSVLGQLGGTGLIDLGMPHLVIFADDPDDPGARVHPGDHVDQTPPCVTYRPAQVIDVMKVGQVALLLSRVDRQSAGFIAASAQRCVIDAGYGLDFVRGMHGHLKHTLWNVRHGLASRGRGQHPVDGLGLVFQVGEGSDVGLSPFFLVTGKLPFSPNIRGFGPHADFLSG